MRFCRINFFAFFLTIVFLVSASCRSAVPEREIIKEKILCIWAHSDIQLWDHTELTQYRQALRDVLERGPHPFCSILAGDILQDSNQRNLYHWYKKFKKESGIKYWYTIAGNHEGKNLETYKSELNMPLNYAVDIGNCRIIFMSNESHGKRTMISDQTFRWWEKMVTTAKHGIIITVTHGSCEGSGLLASRFKRQKIIDSKRFTDFLKKNRVDLWLSGHSHFPGWLFGSWSRKASMNNITFIDLGAIREDFLCPVESRMILLFPETKKCQVIFRNHSGKKDIRILDLELIKTFRWKGQKPALIKGPN